MQVERRGQQGVPPERRAGPHRVLVVAEVREPMRDELIECDEGLRARDRPGEVRERPGVIGKARLHLGEHVAGEGAGGEEGRIGDEPRPLLAVRLPVLGVEVPGAAHGFAGGGEEHAVAFAHLAVEELHAPTVLVLGGAGGEVGAATIEVRVGEGLEGDPDAGADGGDLLFEAVLAGLDHPHAGRGERGELFGEAFRERVGRGVPEGHIVDCEAAGTEGVAVVAHRGEKQGDAGFVVPDVGGLARGLDH